MYYRGKLKIVWKASNFIASFINFDDFKNTIMEDAIIGFMLH